MADPGQGGFDHFPEDQLWTYILVRRDLGMPPGKLAAQAVHAGRLSLLRFVERHPSRASDFLGLNCCGTCVVLEGRHLDDLEMTASRLARADVPHALFDDSGHILLPHFDGGRVTTALAAGPARREDLRPFFKKFGCVA